VSVGSQHSSLHDRVQVYTYTCSLLTGYIFPTADSIRPLVEHPDKSPSREACAEIAQRLGCYVVAGYPAPTLTIQESKDQTGESESAQQSDDTEANTQKAQGVARNNAIVVDPSGNVIHEYTKTNMFEADLPWAQPGAFTGSLAYFSVL
jgi:protein N-terminal amidase